MRERGVAILSILLLLAPWVAVAAVAGSRWDFYAALFAAGVSHLAAIQIWGWVRCRSWPHVTGVFEHTDRSTGNQELQLVYTYGDCTYSRPAQTRGASGTSMSVKVDPRDPRLSSLVVPRPDLSIAVLAVAFCVLVGAALHALAT